MQKTCLEALTTTLVSRRVGAVTPRESTPAQPWSPEFWALLVGSSQKSRLQCQSSDPPAHHCGRAAKALQRPTIKATHGTKKARTHKGTSSWWRFLAQGQIWNLPRITQNPGRIAKSRTPHSGLQYSYGVHYKALRWIYYFLDTYISTYTDPVVALGVVIRLQVGSTFGSAQGS